jgi:hypothetical protein
MQSDNLAKPAAAAYIPDRRRRREASDEVSVTASDLNRQKHKRKIGK